MDDNPKQEISIYQRFKVNSHKILIDNNPLKNLKNNKQLGLIKKKLVSFNS